MKALPLDLLQQIKNNSPRTWVAFSLWLTRWEAANSVYLFNDRTDRSGFQLMYYEWPVEFQVALLLSFMIDAGLVEEDEDEDRTFTGLSKELEALLPEAFSKLEKKFETEPGFQIVYQNK